MAFEGKWLRGLDSNQDNQLQRLACYQLHYPGVAVESVAEIFEICFLRESGFFRALVATCAIPFRIPLDWFAALFPIC